MAGQFAYVLQTVVGNPAHTDLVVVDLTVPATPTIRGRVTVGASALVSVKVIGSLAYVAAGSAGLQIVDVSTPTAPVVIGVVDTPGTASGVAVASGRAYVADGTAVQVIDVSAPNAPFLVGSLATSATGVAVAGSRLYTVDGGAVSKVIDVTNPAAPTLLSATTNSFASQGVAAAGTLMYLASPDVNPTLNKGGLYVVNAAVPTAPTVLANVYGGFDGAGVAVAGSLAVAAGNTAGLRVVDITVPTDPRLLGSLAGNMKAVAMAGQRAYVLQTVSGNPAHTDLLVVNLTLPATPSILGRVNLTPSIMVGVKVVGSLAYVAAGSSGLQIVDVSTPATPTIIGTLDTPGTASGVAVANGYAYVADGTAVRVINVTSPRTPVLVASLATSASAVAVAGTRLYVLGSVMSGTQFQVVDISVPTAPVVLSTWDGLGAQGLDVAGTLAYLATPAIDHGGAAHGVYILDLTSATQVRQLAHVEVPGTTRAVAATTGFVYAGDSAGTVSVIALSP